MHGMHSVKVICGSATQSNGLRKGEQVNAHIPAKKACCFKADTPRVWNMVLLPHLRMCEQARDYNNNNHNTSNNARILLS